MTKPRSWTVTRGWIPHPGAQRHWDRAYQAVLHMAAKHPDEIAIGTAARLTPKESHHAGHSGATLRRPGLDRLRDAVTSAHFERIVITAPDRLARNYVHQVLLVEELQRHGAEVTFLDRPMSQ